MSIFEKTPPLFTYFAPMGKDTIGLVSIPHSGETVPHQFHEFLVPNQKAWAQDVDTKVNELVNISELQEAGIGVLVAHIHRVCVDLNRAPDQSVLIWKENTFGEKCVLKNPSKEQESQIIAQFHQPYFEVLKSLINDCKNKNPGKKVSFVDLHSMPSAPTAYHLKQNPNQKLERADFCVSDQRGKTCVPEFINTYTNNLVGNYSCAINDPYIGGFITTFVDGFETNNIQIEINRKIYMDESSRELKSHLVETLKPHLTQSLIKSFKTFSQT